MNRQKLSAGELTTALESLTSWTSSEAGISREFKFSSYPECVAFAVRVALLAQADDHHPDALTIGWGRVNVTYITHSAGGITALDVNAARKISAF